MVRLNRRGRPSIFPSMRRLSVLLIAMSLGAALPAAASADTTAATSDLLVLDADRGSLVPRGSDRFDLTLRGVDRKVTWFTDRPQRAAGTTGVRTLVRDWAKLGFLRDRPNAAIELPDGATSADTLIVEIGRPRYDRAKATLRVRVRRIATTASVGGHATGADRRLPRRFGRVSLFIDNVPGGRSAGIQVLNDSGTEIAVASASLTGGTWQSPPQPGTGTEPLGVAQWSNVPSSAFGPIGGQMILSTPATGTFYTISWNWAWGSMLTAQATATSVGSSGRATTLVIDQGSYQPTALVVIAAS